MQGFRVTTPMASLSGWECFIINISDWPILKYFLRGWMQRFESRTLDRQCDRFEWDPNMECGPSSISSYSGVSGRSGYSDNEIRRGRFVVSADGSGLTLEVDDRKDGDEI